MILPKRSPQRKLKRSKDYQDKENRLIYWRDLDRIENVGHLINQDPEIPYEDVQKKRLSLGKAVSSVVSKGFNMVVVDITLPEIKEQGFETLKIVVPELHPLYLDEGAKSLYSVHHGEIKEDPMLKPHPVT